MTLSISRSVELWTERWGIPFVHAEPVEPWLSPCPSPEEPIRTDLWNVEQLQCHARRLADRHRWAVGSSRNRLLRRLDENVRILREANRVLGTVARDETDVPEAVVWLLDNFYLIQDQINVARRDLPQKYSMGLPVLTGGPCEGLPRVYELALELTVHLDGFLNQETLDAYVSAYQDVSLLTLGELWAIPIMLRLAGLENLRRLAVPILLQQQNTDRGRAWADRIRAADCSDETERLLHELADRERPLSSAFVAGLIERLSDPTPSAAYATDWLEEYLGRRGESISQLVELDGRHRTANTAAVRNSILSLRTVAALDWKQFIEKESVVEQTLRRDPAGVYAQMNFASRDRYRYIVEKIAQHSLLTEHDVAERILDLAQRGTGMKSPLDGPPTRREQVVRCHVGYYLVDEGLATIKKEVGYRHTWREAITRFTTRAPFGCYTGSLLLVWLATIAAATIAAKQARITENLSWEAELLLGALLGGVAIQFAVNLVNWALTLLVPPRPMMRLDFTNGIPAEHRTLAAVPALLSNAKTLQELVRGLEIRYLANRDENLWFALLTDFPDAPRETLPGDHRLLRLARTAIDRLNRRYGVDGRGPFYWFHRPRRWNPHQGVWMAEERKRGKLADLNALLRTGRRDAFSAMSGAIERLSSVRYVITLDADTRLPPQVGRDLVGSMAHPLNWPEIDPATRIVVAGHAILQPCIGTLFPEADRSPFSRLLACDAGIDPYTKQSSNVYQDAFDRGSFVGKGIYDVEAFETVMAERLPNNRILSHDLIEGCFARSGTVGDAELFEKVPFGFLAEMGRRHRWVRGDWQIGAWLWPWAPTCAGRGRNPLDALSRWKILDNLRRSLTPVFFVVLLGVAWTAAPGAAGYSLLLALLLFFGPTLATLFPGLTNKPREKPWRLHFEDRVGQWRRTLAVEAFSWCVLPYTACCNIDAIARALYRMHVSRRNLLQWITSSDAETREPTECRRYYAAMWPCWVAALLATLGLTWANPAVLLIVGPALASWLGGPWIAWRISQPYRRQAIRLTEQERRQMGRWARRTWHYFDVMVNEEHHWLPPDNVQEEPRWMVAHRTSPTNIGMGLLANLAAYDLGYVSAATLLERTQRTFHTLGQLERYRGHFLNWYDTHTLRANEPRYVSSVDSGNLWGSLSVLEVGLKELRVRPLMPSQFLQGLRDTLGVIISLRPSDAENAFDARLLELQEMCRDAMPRSMRHGYRRLGRIRALAADLAVTARDLSPEIRQWTDALERQTAAIHRDLGCVAFWIWFPSFFRKGTRKHFGVLSRFSLAPCNSMDGHADGAAAVPHFYMQESGNGLLQQVMTRTNLHGKAREERLVMMELRRWILSLDRGCSLQQVASMSQRIANRITRLFDQTSSSHESNGDSRNELHGMLIDLRRAARWAASAARRQLRQIAALRQQCRQFSDMDFRFLYHRQRELLSIGYDLGQQRCDDSYYGLLASEARLTSFLAVSHGQLPLDHWFALSRVVTLVQGKPVLLSWAGSMFEYLMPMLLMPSYPGTIVDWSCHRAVQWQIHYAGRNHVPWGVSESCFSDVDDNQAYQYRAFGTPGLGLKRGLGDRLVIAPYASALASMVVPQEACRNLEKLEQAGYLGTYGFYDAIDYAFSHHRSIPEPSPCRTVMAHHSGMAILAFCNVLFSGSLSRRFAKIPLHAAFDALLQERMSPAIRPMNVDDH